MYGVCVRPPPLGAGGLLLMSKDTDIRKSVRFRLLHFDTSRSSTYPIYPNMHGKLTPNVSVHKNRTRVNSDLAVGYLKKCRSSEVSSFFGLLRLSGATPCTYVFVVSANLCGGKGTAFFWIMQIKGEKICIYQFFFVPLHRKVQIGVHDGH